MTPLVQFFGPPKQKFCSKCAASFTCGPERGQKKCWCDELPHVPLVASEDQGCLCPKCLREAISNLNALQLAAVGAHPLKKPNETSRPTLIEGEDYY